MRVSVLAVVFSCTISTFAGTPSVGPAGGPNVIGPVSELKIVNKVIAPDGFARSAVLAGGTLPGPLIAATKGDDFKINVVNSLNDTSLITDTSVHFHGISQVKSNWADGVVGVTQCPIPTNNSFLHEFNALNQTGTFWYHSHLSSQYCDGLRGPLVIYDPDDPHQDLYDVDDPSTVITLTDWYHQPSLTLTVGPYLTNATLVNGHGRYAGGPPIPPSVIGVEQGKRYRFRIVGMACDGAFNFSIDGHPMTVIETDGIETQPLIVDSLAIYPGQRYSVVVTANQTVDNYWIRVVSNNLYQNFAGMENTAILSYAGAPAQDPTTQHGPYVLPYNEGNVVPLVSPGAPGIPGPGNADISLNLVPGLVTVNNKETFSINGVPFIAPAQPVLLQILSGVSPSSLLPTGNVYQLPRGKVVEISMPATDLNINGAGGPHTLHLHGQTFDVVRVPGSSTYNYANPIRRDTIPIGVEAQNDNLTLRFVTNNAGPWMIHCHTNFHLRDGFGAVLAAAPADTITEEKPIVPDYWYKLCDGAKGGE